MLDSQNFLASWLSLSPLGSPILLQTRQQCFRSCEADSVYLEFEARTTLVVPDSYLMESGGGVCIRVLLRFLGESR